MGTLLGIIKEGYVEVLQIRVIMILDNAVRCICEPKKNPRYFSRVIFFNVAIFQVFDSFEVPVKENIEEVAVR